MEVYIFNFIGLALDITGVVLLFFFGLPSEVTKGGTIGYIAEQPDQEELKKWKKYKQFANIALALLIAGFFFQFASTFMGMINRHIPPCTENKEK